MRKYFWVYSLLVCSFIFPFFTSAGAASSAEAVPTYGFEVVAVYKHDSQAFTQGLLFDDGFLFESTGLYGHSSLRRSTLSGEEPIIRYLPKHFFAEGITIWEDKIFQLTWKSRTGLIWQKDSLTLLGTFIYHSEGWGITHDDQWLIMSDGTATLSFIDPDLLTLHHRILVSDGNLPLHNLNELEFINGEIWANIWRDNRIARIDPESGKILGWIDFSKLVESVAPTGHDNVLNGIAYDKENNRIFVTGKRWPQIFEIKVVSQLQK